MTTSADIGVLRLEYRNHFVDVLLFTCIHQFLTPILQVVFGGFACFVYVQERVHGSIWALSVALGWYVAMWFLQIVFNALHLFTRRSKSVLTEHALEVRDEWLLEETKYNKSYFYWPGVTKVVARPGFMAVYVTPHQAHVVPDRAFASRVHKGDFLRAIRARIQRDRAT